jgi:hypothetical protein
MDAPFSISTSISRTDAPFWHFNIHLKSHGAVSGLSALEEYMNHDSKKEHDEDTSNSSFSC